MRYNIYMGNGNHPSHTLLIGKAPDEQSARLLAEGASRMLPTTPITITEQRGIFDLPSTAQLLVKYLNGKSL